MSPLQQARLSYKPILPKILEKMEELSPSNKESSSKKPQELAEIFPETFNQQILEFKVEQKRSTKPHRVGVVLSGGQAPGGHNVIAGLFDALKKLDDKSALFGFLNGPSGIIKNKSIEITQELLNAYRNQGGFDIIGSGRTKIETPEQYKAAEDTVKAMKLDGLVIIGGDDSNTNAAILAEYFKKNNVGCTVVGVPKTIDGDLKNEFIEMSFGFDTACKTYSEIIGNILKDSLSAKKLYYFIKMMGRSASHIALECALQTHPNMAFIAEEVESEKKTLSGIIQEISDLICSRAVAGKDFGVILIPEGIVEFIPEFKLLIQELNRLLSPDTPHQRKIDGLKEKGEGIDYIMKYLGTSSVQCFKSLPKEIQLQLMMDRDPHGNVQVSKIETERLLIEMVKKELELRKRKGSYGGSFSSQPHFCGYEGRSSLPSNFDSQYCYALGYTAALLVDIKATGYMSCVRKLTNPVVEWEVCGVPLVDMMTMEERHGKTKPVIKKALVDLQGRAFTAFKQNRGKWAMDDDYTCPGPIQFFGPPELTDSVVLSLKD